MKRQRPEWAVVTTSGDLLLGYKAAKQLQVLAVPPPLTKQIANYLLIVSAELADRGVLEPEIAAAEP